LPTGERDLTPPRHDPELSPAAPARTGPASSKAERRRRLAAERALRRRPLPNVPLLIPALLGIALAGYLTVVAILDTLPAACAAGSGCDLVQTSRFASFLGVPTAAWGLAGYVSLTLVALFVRDVRRHAALALALAAAALGVSVYLTAVSVFTIGATCYWCLASLTLVAACFTVATMQRLQTPALGPAWRPLAGSGVAIVLVAGLLHLHYRGDLGGAGPEDPRLRALAIHLEQSVAKFYGASWCSHCVQQKELFGASAHRLPYTECSPGGRPGPPVAVCRAAGATSYPTWIIDGARSTGTLSIAELAERSGFSWDAATQR
jgi:uncharacterized membrane protein